MKESRHVSTTKKPTSLGRGFARPLEERIQDLVDEMHACLTERRRVDLSMRSHREITEALHHLVYEQGESTTLKFRYADSNSKEQFPVRNLALPQARLPWQDGQILHIGTLTFRHVNYDDAIDRYLIRDRETRSLSSADIENLAYTRMKEVLDDQELKKPSFMKIYQTGLEPLVVGLYRALVEHLEVRCKEGLPQLVVQPVFFIDKNGRKDSSTSFWG